MTMIKLVKPKPKPLDVLKAEIAELHAVVVNQFKMTLESAIKAGEKLIEFKAQCAHGEYEKAIKEIGLSKSTAARYKRLAENKPLLEKCHVELLGVKGADDYIAEKKAAKTPQTEPVEVEADDLRTAMEKRGPEATLEEFEAAFPNFNVTVEGQEPVEAPEPVQEPEVKETPEPEPAKAEKAAAKKGAPYKKMAKAEPGEVDPVEDEDELLMERLDDFIEWFDPYYETVKDTVDEIGHDWLIGEIVGHIHYKAGAGE